MKDNGEVYLQFLDKKHVYEVLQREYLNIHKDD